MSELRLRLKMHGRLSKGGYLYSYSIIDGDEVVGAKNIMAETRKAQPTITYVLGDDLFDTPAEFKAAYQAQKSAGGRPRDGGNV